MLTIALERHDYTLADSLAYTAEERRQLQNLLLRQFCTLASEDEVRFSRCFRCLPITSASKAASDEAIRSRDWTQAWSLATSASQRRDVVLSLLRVHDMRSLVEAGRFVEAIELAVTEEEIKETQEAQEVAEHGCGEPDQRYSPTNHSWRSDSDDHTPHQSSTFSWFHLPSVTQMHRVPSASQLHRVPSASRIHRMEMPAMQSLNTTPRDTILWQLNSDSPHCVVCFNPFSFVRRRHHCRTCGKLVCASCSTGRQTVEGSSNQRICDSCVAGPATPPWQEGESGSNCDPDYMADGEMTWRTSLD